MTNAEFVRRVQEIAQTNPTYRTGGTGADGTCDCIGLIMGALGGTFPLHSSNWFARYRTDNLAALMSENPLTPGALVYKAREGTAQLNARYQPGGRYYTGDMLDYYHVGVVTGTDPLEITHCTSTDSVDGIARDGSIKGWTHFGTVQGLQAEEPTVSSANELAVVYSENGKPVKMRPTPSTNKPYIAEVPYGAQVEILEQADGWATVRWNGLRGYMMSEYLRTIGMVTAEPETGEGYTLTLSADTAAELLAALRKAGVTW